MTPDTAAPSQLGRSEQRPGRDVAGPRPVPWVASLEPAVHGAVPTESSAGPARTVLDFSANGNVLGPSPAVSRAIAEVDLAAYPDRQARALRGAIGARHGVDDGSVLVGNGSTELIWAIARAYLAPGDFAVVLGPTYGEYAVAAAACGAEVRTVPVVPPRFESGSPAILDLPPLLRHLEHIRPKTIWLCHPNNPTGAPFPIGLLPRISAAAPEALIVVDEAYLPFTAGAPSALPCIASGRVAVIRSLTKDAGLAGLRLGYALAAPAAADVVRRVLPPWSVSALAQAGALAALADVEHAQQVDAAVRASREHLRAGLQQLGLPCYPSVTNFVLVPVGNGAAVTGALLARGIAVRDCTSFGLPDCIRIGVRSIADQELLLSQLATVLTGER